MVVGTDMVADKSRVVDIGKVVGMDMVGCYICIVDLDKHI